MGLGMGHIRSFSSNDRLGQYRIPQELVPVRYIYLGCRGRLRIALHYGNADGCNSCTAGFCLHHRRIDGFYPDGVRSKGVGRGFGFLAGICIFCGSAAGFHRNGRGAFIIGFGRVHHYSAPAYAYAGGLGRYPAGPLCLQSNGSRNLFCCFFAVAARYLLCLRRFRLQRAVAFYSYKIIGRVGVMGHADRHCHSGCRYADHIDLALGGVAGFHRQVAVGGGQRAVVYSNAGVAFGGKPGVAYADPHGAQSRLHGPQVDGVFLIFRHIALTGRQGHAGAFHGGILY